MLVDLKNLMATRLAFCDREICQQASVQLKKKKKKKQNKFLFVDMLCV